MLVDVVLYGGEAEILKCRLDHMKADLTVIVEGDRTFTNEWKGWTFDDVWDDLREYHDRLVFHGIRSPEFSDPWANEAHQRNTAQDVLFDLDLFDDAIVALFDTDEIPDPVILREKPGVYGWLMAKYQMSVFWFQRKELTGVSAPWGWLRGQDLEQVRKRRGLHETMDAGFHLSSFGSYEDVMTKWRGFAHTELWRHDMPEWVLHCWENGRAIDNAEWLEQTAEMNAAFPEYLKAMRGPSHWYRRRP